MTRLTRRALPPLEFLNELFAVDKTSPSGLRRKKTVSTNAQAGSAAGTYMPKVRYWVVNITYEGSKHMYYVHRIVYSMATGKNIDNTFIDHIDTVDKQNVISNLREASHKENMRNRGISKSKRTSKYKCVYWNERRRRWIAKMQANNKYIWIGTYFNEDDAARAYNEAALLHHGEFASLNDVPM